ncbi:hypothetical protein J6590_010897, partial [Homalodisca vitripennis]
LGIRICQDSSSLSGAGAGAGAIVPHPPVGLTQNTDDSPNPADGVPLSSVNTHAHNYLTINLLALRRKLLSRLTYFIKFPPGPTLSKSPGGSPLSVNDISPLHRYVPDLGRLERSSAFGHFLIVTTTQSSLPAFHGLTVTQRDLCQSGDWIAEAEVFVPACLSAATTLDNGTAAVPALVLQPAIATTTAGTTFITYSLATRY